MKNMTFKVISTAIVLAATVGSFSVFAHQSEHQGKDMMGEDMKGMADMMKMMSSMSDKDRSAMHEACMKMMQSHSDDNMGGGANEEGADAN